MKQSPYELTLLIIIGGCFAQYLLWLLFVVDTGSIADLMSPWLLFWTALPCIILAAAARSFRESPRAAMALLVAAGVNAFGGVASTASVFFDKPDALSSIVFFSVPFYQLLFVLVASAIAWLLQVFSPERSIPAPPPIE